MMIKKNMTGIVFSVIFIFTVAGFGAISGAKPVLGEAKPAPDITLKDLKGNKFKLSDHQGKVVIVNFWAVWCPPCKLEIPDLVELYKKYKEQGLVILGIAIDSGKDKKIKAKAQELGINYPVINGNNYYIRKSFGGIRAVPTTFVINQEGNFFKNYVGYQKRQVLEEDIKTLLHQ